ncbi:MAG: hypothetical protein A3H72_00490 [Candidatus Doudnabacteria bacterium RIFCSPLOWO2_02_FULL_48_8]|uniref:Uncharacterized protein n=1 Tax=Candidatus Doudnabacteria bacterium RIFCSPHIGHO2_01_FULL_46_24 TaxID=1817825 RepID=A0A1F5NUE9_9BACT|nr:MAG: hypothetical protein A2720_03480 [Candidatus Doudnabacteria bacterium RIFCSPHIGHO2_01_FULL_46_24]OGE95050.1 MAG: hypothetical protein A3H72_00490 [Candidatus Doudnabacteria bacterium RIFCSPLOWO2_02_FULL_48_8]OGE95821.1 MAG: hypothetical protein A3E98_03320 [Candidatus Doudnabacteria bacterium RIFCSPHIGHO2_12_FULL_48_11]
MNPWIIIWPAFWITAIGLPLYLFKKHQITFHQKSWQHTLFFIFLSIALLFVYQNFFSIYFNNLSLYPLLAVACLFLLWLWALGTFPNDYYTKQERFGYQLSRFSKLPSSSFADKFGVQWMVNYHAEQK